MAAGDLSGEATADTVVKFRAGAQSEGKRAGHFVSKKKRTPFGVRFFLEVPARFELADESFADSCLTTWPRYHIEIRNAPRS